MAKSKDLFDDTTMSFGEHLEVLRIHLWKAILGLAVCVIIALFFGDRVVAAIRAPIDRALQEHGAAYVDDEFGEKLEGFDWRNMLDSTRSFFGGKPTTANSEPAVEKNPATAPAPADRRTIRVQMFPSEMAAVLHVADPERYPPPEKREAEKPVWLSLQAAEFEQFHKTADRINRPIALNVQEAFLTYLKVAFVAGLVLASPWVIYQLWLFVASGLYPHERKYVYAYLPMSVGLFLVGVFFCFYAVFPFVLSFLLSFNTWLEVTPQIRLSEWISFAIMLPLLFGVSFQLPMVMLFLERISVFEAQDYREKRRMAVLTIAIISMLLTPADPMSMLMMMVPLLLLYEFGILLCSYSPARSPFETEAA